MNITGARDTLKTTTGEGTLQVPGANLHYRVRGTGPVLLILQGGAADGEGSENLVKHLVEQYTIVTYDRRGLSRSKLNGPAEALRIETHSDDAHRLLAALTKEPAFVLGISIGALIGLDLVARHPGQVSLLVAHEPPAEALLPDDERARALQLHAEVEQTYRREGAAAAMKMMVAASEVNFDDREPEVELPRPDPARAAAMAANMNFFLSRDAPAAHQYQWDLAALNAARNRIVPAAGRNSGEIMARHSAISLASRLGTPLVEFPGGHSAYVLRPREFAARLHEVLSAR